jgi:hypothetical protein
MNRLLVLIASVGVAFLAISSTCVASPRELQTLGTSSTLVAAADAPLASGWSASVAPSEIVGSGLLSM